MNSDNLFRGYSGWLLIDLMKDCIRKSEKTEILILATSIDWWQRKIFTILDLTESKCSFNVQSNFFQLNGGSKIHLISGSSSPDKLQGLSFDNVIADWGVDADLLETATTLIVFKKKCRCDPNKYYPETAQPIIGHLCFTHENRPTYCHVCKKYSNGERLPNDDGFFQVIRSLK